MRHSEETKKRLSLISKKQWKDGRVSTKGLFKKGQLPWNKGIHQWEGKKHPGQKEKINKICLICKKVFKVLPSRNKRKLCSLKCQKIQIKSRIKENHPNWKGGIKIDNDRRKSFEGVQWRSDVFQRDNWICQTCGVRGGVVLQAHHKKSWAEYPEFRYDVDNGVTLCISCHKLTDNYGRRNKK
jgi:hypothetical protein